VPIFIGRGAPFFRNFNLLVDRHSIRRYWCVIKSSQRWLKIKVSDLKEDLQKTNYEARSMLTISAPLTPAEARHESSIG